MARSLDDARAVVELSRESEALITSRARPIVLAPARVRLPFVAPDDDRLGVMLPYAPVHHLLFASGAPGLLVMTSANRSSEPIAFEDADAFDRLAGLADAFLVGERAIARRVDDSVACAGALGPVILRRSRGYAPEPVASVPDRRPILAVGADLKNAVTLAVDGQAFVSQHIGDLDEAQSREAFRAAIRDLLAMYRVDEADLTVVHDAHPEYASTRAALEIPAKAHFAVQHHRAHVASVLAEHGDWDRRVLGISFDGTGFGDDGTIWGGEIFAGSLRDGLARVAHVRPALLPGGDAAARHPVRAAAGFLSGLERLPDLEAAPFRFPPEFRRAMQVLRAGVRTFTTTSAGRLFDTAAALLGFVRPVTFEGQAAMWVEALARRGGTVAAYPFPFVESELDYRPLLAAMIRDRLARRPVEEIARAFQRGVAEGLAAAATELCRRHRLAVVAVSGGVFQNDLLVSDLAGVLEPAGIRVLGNHSVPPNDGGISLGQAALAAMAAGR
jgi:hydrogenase maturation protein HypF